MKGKKSLLMVIVMIMIIFVSCSKEELSGPKESLGLGSGKKQTTKLDTSVPKLVISWGKSLHTGMMQLGIVNYEFFKDKACHLKPITERQLELIKDGKVIALLDVVENEGGADAATMMTQGHVDVSYNSSTAIIAAYDSGADLCILCPIQSGGVSIVASANAPYDTFEELVDYAKDSKMPILGGYHSPISSPRIVLEYALREQGVIVTGDTAHYDADIFMTDLKGISNLIPSLSSGQVELWAGPVPNPQNAEAQGIGKIIARLDDLPGGKWVDFPCCTMNVRNKVKEAHPEIIKALIQVTTDISEFAQNNKEETVELILDYIGLSRDVLLRNDTTYATDITDNFTNGMNIYYEVMKDMGKFTGRLKDKPANKGLPEVLDLSFMEKK